LIQLWKSQIAFRAYVLMVAKRLFETSPSSPDATKWKPGLRIDDFPGLRFASSGLSRLLRFETAINSIAA